jgi:hypothetical protein
MKIDFKELVKLVEEVSTNYQKSDRIKKHASKRMSTKGKTNKDGTPYSQDPPTARAKSAPPGFGFTMEELYKLIDEVLLEQEPEEEEPEEEEGGEAPEQEQPPASSEEPPAQDAQQQAGEGEISPEAAEPGDSAPLDSDDVPAPLKELAVKALELFKETFPKIAFKPQGGGKYFWVRRDKTPAIEFTNTGSQPERHLAWQKYAEAFPSHQLEVEREQKGNNLNMKITAGDVSLEVVLAKGASTGATVTNRGDVAEGILAAALAVRFSKPEEGALITKEDIIATLELLNKQSGDEGKKTMAKEITFPKHETSTEGVFDTVKLKVGLSANNFMDLMDPEKRASVDDLYDSCVAYANSAKVVGQGIDWYMNDVENIVEVVADGTADQKGTKVDLRIRDNGKEISIGKLSLKAGATDQLGQYGRKWEAVKLLFTTMFGVDLSERNQESYVKAVADYPNHKKSPKLFKAITPVYEEAYQALRKTLSGDDPSAEEEFLEQFKTGIRYQAVLGEENVEFVQLTGRTYKQLDFGPTLDKISEEANLAVKLKPSKGGTPYLWIFDANMGAEPTSANALIVIRPKAEASSGAIRHYVEKRNRLVQLLQVKD